MYFDSESDLFNQTFIRYAITNMYETFESVGYVFAWAVFVDLGIGDVTQEYWTYGWHKDGKNKPEIKLKKEENGEYLITLCNTEEIVKYFPKEETGLI